MNIYEVASEAGVSISTVSRVINSPEKVAPATRARVQEVLAKNNYVPNALARGLAQSSIKNVGILVSGIQNLYHATAAHTLEDAFFHWGYTSYFCPTGDSLEKKLTYIRTLSEKQVDGLILIGSIFSSPVIEKHLHSYMPNTPIATINGWISGPNIYTVSLNQSVGMEMILNHLQERGYEHLYFVHSVENQNTTKKITAFRTQTAERGLSQADGGNVIFCERNFDAFYEFAKEFVPTLQPHTAVIFHDEVSAGFGCSAFRKLGVSIPRDLGVVGYDNICYPILHYPDITCLDTKISVLSSMAANVLHDLFSQKPVSHAITVAPELVIRSST